MTTHSSTPAHRVVLVTGAGTGIGRATARAFAAEGATVIAVGRRPGPLAETAARPDPGADCPERAAGRGRIVPLVADVTGPGEPESIAAAVAEHGRLDVLVHNAGIVRGGALESVTAENSGAELATNVIAPVLLTRALLPLLERAGGVVIGVGTATGQRGWPGNATYAASKAALDSLVRSWAVELAPRGIRVVAVAPGAVDTPIGEHRGLTPDQVAAVRDWQVAHTPLGRIGRPEEIAWAITTLAAPAAAFVTGAVLVVDGGAGIA